MKSTRSLTSGALFLLPILLLSSCDSSKTELPANTNPSLVTSEVINGIVVPLEPDPVKNNATLAGVDSNNNGVRDDVERKIAVKITSDVQYSTTIKVAKAYQLLLTKPLPTTRAEALRAYGDIACASGTGVAYGQSSNAVSHMIFDTASRKDILSKINKLLDGGFDGEELPACP